VAVVSQTLANRHFSGENPIGRRIVVNAFGELVTAEIVGIVGDVRHESLESVPTPTVYVPFIQRPQPNMVLVLHFSSNPETISTIVRREVRLMDKSLLVSNIASLEQLIDSSVAEHRFRVALLSSFAFLAVILAVLAVYGIVSFMAAERAQEIGIRMALGASRSSVLTLVISQAVWPALVGAVLGLVSAIALSRLMSHLLFGIEAVDLQVLTTVPLLLMFATIMASAIPGWKAARVDPAAALKRE
jgi:ABC-type antimicrobial peptide transport system permease subunit